MHRESQWGQRRLWKHLVLSFCGWRNPVLGSKDDVQLQGNVNCMRETDSSSSWFLDFSWNSLSSYLYIIQLKLLPLSGCEKSCHKALRNCLHVTKIMRSTHLGFQTSVSLYGTFMAFHYLSQLSHLYLVSQIKPSQHFLIVMLVDVQLGRLWL